MNDATLERDIRKELRASMNGILSARMRQAGMPFTLIFGTELPRLEGIADEFPKSVSLSCRLWNTRVREMRLLSVMLMPPEDFTPELAGAWMSSLVTAEEAQVMALRLLPKMPGALPIALGALCQDGALQIIAGALTLRHWLLGGTRPSPEEEAMVRQRLQALSADAPLSLAKALCALSEALDGKKNDK